MKKAKGSARFPLPFVFAPSYLASSAVLVSSPFLARLAQLYFFVNFSTRPVVSTYFILPVKNGWQTEQISTAMFFLVLRVTNLLPQPQVTVVSSYFGWMSFFMILHYRDGRAPAARSGPSWVARPESSKVVPPLRTP